VEVNLASLRIRSTGKTFLNSLPSLIIFLVSSDLTPDSYTSPTLYSITKSGFCFLGNSPFSLLSDTFRFFVAGAAREEER
jgi:hypothetical protein